MSKIKLETYYGLPEEVKFKNGVRPIKDLPPPLSISIRLIVKR